MDNQPMPQAPMTVLAAGAAQCHELFMSYVTAGFTRAEALQLVITIMNAGMNNMNGGSQ